MTDITPAQMRELANELEQKLPQLINTPATLRSAAAQIDKLTDQIDLMRDEFLRIKASPGCDPEIAYLCERAIIKIDQHVPVIVQRDIAENRCITLTAENARLTIALQDIRDECQWAANALNESDRHIRVSTALVKCWSAIPTPDRNVGEP